MSVMSNLRIAYFIDDLIHGGTQTWLTILAEGLHGLGYEQRIYCMRNRAHPQNVQTLQQWAKVNIIGEPRLWAIEGLIHLYQELKQWQPHLVQTMLPTADVVGRTMGHLVGIPVIVSSIRTRNCHKSRWQLFWDHLTIRWACRVIFNSQEVIPFALTHEGVIKEQIVYIPNGARIPQPKSATRTAALRAELGLTYCNVKVLAMVARLHPQKGHRDLLQASALALKEIPNMILLIIGDGPLRQSLEVEVTGLGIAAQVRFLGDRSDVPDLLSMIDLYVHSSLFEGMPNAVMEAMTAARPVIATAIDGAQTLIVDGESGWLVEPGNPAALAARIIFALRHPETARQMGLAAAERIKHHFSADRMVAAYHALYQELILERTC
ncbi:MAG: glycosyltransferase [Anaerolineae bacterium]|nr:glycosyltransferase [Anaerolineae bacterium]